MSDLENKEYVLSIISRIDFPGNSDLIRLIEHIDVTEKSVKIIINSEMKSRNKMITDQWQRFIERDNKLESNFDNSIFTVVISSLISFISLFLFSLNKILSFCFNAFFNSDLLDKRSTLTDSLNNFFVISILSILDKFIE